MRGIPTVLVTVSPDVSAQMRPPRALYPNGFKIGNSIGRPGMRALQRGVVKDALELVKQNTRPGQVIVMDYPEYGDFHEPVRTRGN
jgi:hypothetical protein